MNDQIDQIPPDITYEKLCEALSSRSLAPHTTFVWANRLDPNGTKNLDPMKQPLVPTLTIRLKMPYANGHSGIRPEDAQVGQKQIKKLIAQLSKELKSLNTKTSALWRAVEATGVRKVFVELTDKGKQGHLNKTTLACESPWIAKPNKSAVKAPK